MIEVVNQYQHSLVITDEEVFEEALRRDRLDSFTKRGHKMKSIRESVQRSTIMAFFWLLFTGGF